MCLCYIVLKKENSYEKDRNRKNANIGVGTFGYLVGVGHNIVARLGYISHYGRFGNGVSSHFRFGDTNVVVVAIDVGNTLSVFVRPIVGKQKQGRNIVGGVDGIFA
jgi:hypothetical protein